MSFFDDDAAPLEPHPPRPRRTGSRRRLRLQRLGIFLVVLFAIVFVLALAIRACQRNAKESAYRTYFSSIQSVIDDSNAVGRDLGAILANPPRDRRTLNGKLVELVNRQNVTADRAQAIKPPGKLSQLHSIFVMGMKVRASGVDLASQWLLAALGKKNVTATAKKLATLSGYFAGPDVYYQELYQTPAKNVMAKEGVTNVAVPVSDYFLRNDIFDRQSLEAALTRMSSTSSLSGIHGVSLVKVVAVPANVTLKPGQDTQVTSSSDLKFRVTVENQGSVTENAIPIKVTFTAAGGASQKLSATIDALGPGESQSVDIDVTVPPEALSKTSQLKVTAGPVPGEKKTDNNSATYGVILTY